MHVISRKALTQACARLPASQRSTAKTVLASWYKVVSAGKWDSFADVKQTFNTADYVGGGKVVFDVGGNKYRIVGLIGYRSKKIFVLFVGTHKEYDDLSIDDL